MQLWQTHFRSDRPLEHLPRPLLVASERRYDLSYHHRGRYRQGERHCLLQCTLSGEGRFRDAGAEYPLPAGRAFLCEVRDPNTSYYYPPGAAEPWEFVYFCFVGGAVRQAVAEFVGRYGPVYDVPRDGTLMEQFLAWRSHSGTEAMLTPGAGARMVTEVLAALADSRHRPFEQDPAGTLVRQAQEAVRCNLERDMNVGQLAGRLGVSREHLTRVFREQTRTTPHAYILRRKMLLACRLLKDTDLSGAQVAARLGYREPAHFCRVFKRVMRMTPGRFRQVGVVPVV